MSEVESYAARMHAARGYRDSRAAVCPRVVAGKRCLAYTRSWTRGFSEECPCREHSHLFDHAAIWLDGEGRHVFTAEPYHINPEDLARAQVDLTSLGLVLEVTTESYWFSGTTLLVVRRP